MIRLRAFFSALPGLLLLGTAAAGHAAPAVPDRNATATAEITAPAQVRKLQDLNFASLTVSTAGTATVDPNTETMTTTGGVIHAAGVPHAALFEGISPRKGVVIVRLPRQPITISRVGGTETMTVDNWTISGNGKRTVTAQEPFDFRVGGTLHVNADQAEGTYVGTFSVEIQYP